MEADHTLSLEKTFDGFAEQHKASLSNGTAQGWVANEGQFRPSKRFNAYFDTNARTFIR